MSNIILALMENDSPDAFANDVANAYFQNPAHVRSLLNDNCINECVDYVLDNQRVEFDLSDLALFEDEPFFAKPSRQRGKRKHNKKAVRRKGSAKRFRDRSRKCASEGHTIHVYHRGMVGDWSVRGRALEEAGEVAVRNSYRIVRDIEVDPEALKEEETETRTFTYADGFTLSMSMSKSAWEKEEEDDFDPDYNWSKKYDIPEFYWNDHYWDDRHHADDDSEDEDNGIKLPAECQTWEFSPQELADIMQKLANATPEQRALVRQFFAEKL